MKQCQGKRCQNKAKMPAMVKVYWHNLPLLLDIGFWGSKSALHIRVCRASASIAVIVLLSTRPIYTYSYWQRAHPRTIWKYQMLDTLLHCMFDQILRCFVGLESRATGCNCNGGARFAQSGSTGRAGLFFLWICMVPCVCHMYNMEVFPAERQL